MSLEKNFRGMFYQDRVIMCPYCQIKFSTIPQLKFHKENYCTTKDGYELLDDMFKYYSDEVEQNGQSAMVNEKNFVVIKGLYLLRAEWDLFFNYLDNPKETLLAEQQEKKKLEGNTRKPHFEAMFSDFNVEAENLEKYPFLEGELQERFGEDLAAFGFNGEATDADAGLGSGVPDWLKGTKIDEIQNDKIKVTKNYLDDITNKDLDNIKKKNFNEMSSEQLFRDGQYSKLLNVMRNDVNDDLGANTVEYLLSKPAANWEAAFFDNQREPSRFEVEDVMVELERPEPRKNRYVEIMNDLWSIYNAMTSSLLTEVDLKKRSQVSKLIAERELLFRKETLWVLSIKDFKELYFQKMDREYIALPVKPKVQKAFVNLFLKIRYKK